MRYLLIPALALALSACTGMGTLDTATNAGAAAADIAGVTPPAAYADKTVMDETGMRSAELLYKTARMVVELGVDSGRLKGANAATAARFDNEAYRLLGVMRTAYRAGNAGSWRTALGEMKAIVASINTITAKES